MTGTFLALYTDHLVAFICLLVLSALYFRFISGSQFLFCLLNTAVTWLIGGLLKYYFWLPRPFMLTGKLPLINFGTDGSFPSNHTVFAFSLALSVFCFRRRLGTGLLFLAAAVAIGRIQAGVHVFRDVLGAVILSGIWVYLSRRYLYSRFSD